MNKPDFTFHLIRNEVKLALIHLSLDGEKIPNLPRKGRTLIISKPTNLIPNAISRIDVTNPSDSNLFKVEMFYSAATKKQA